MATCEPEIKERVVYVQVDSSGFRNHAREIELEDQINRLHHELKMAQAEVHRLRNRHK